MRPQIAQPRGCKVTLATFVWFVFNDRHSYWICLVIYRHIMIPNILFHHHPVNDVVLCWTVGSIWGKYYILISDWEKKKWKWMIWILNILIWYKDTQLRLCVLESWLSRGLHFGGKHLSINFNLIVIKKIILITAPRSISQPSRWWWCRRAPGRWWCCCSPLRCCSGFAGTSAENMKIMMAVRMSKRFKKMIERLCCCVCWDTEHSRFGGKR